METDVCSIKKLILNNDEEILINKNDIVVFVGPNNSGKSQSLRDIFNICQENRFNRIVIKDALLDVDINKVQSVVSKVAFKDIYGSYHYLGDNINFDISNTRLGGTSKVFISYLKTDERLSYCKQQPNLDVGKKPSHPMQLMIDDEEYKNKLSSLFCGAFQQRLYLSKRATISIKIGEIDDRVVSGASRLAIADAVQAEIDNLPDIQNQGDGMRSFVSILLSLGMDYKKIHLMDEPESFLHQVQARILGRMIADQLKEDQQAFISTHSSDFIKGLLEKAEKRVKIIRITRSGNTNFYNILDNNQIQEICNDEMLKHTNLLEGLFSEKVVVCESDVDCLLYSSLEEYLQNQKGRYSENLYLYTGGKSSFKKTLSALKGLGIHSSAVLDLDALNDEALIKSNYEICGGDWQNDIKPHYDSFIKWISNAGSIVTKSSALSTITDVISRCANENLTPSDIRKIKSCVKSNDAWDKIKEKGKNFITDSKVLKEFNAVLAKLCEKGIFLVPNGELESFIPDCDGHSHAWLQKVFKNHPTFDDPAYAELITFIKSFM